MSINGQNYCELFFVLSLLETTTTTCVLRHKSSGLLVVLHDRLILIGRDFIYFVPLFLSPLLALMDGAPKPPPPLAPTNYRDKNPYRFRPIKKELSIRSGWLFLFYFSLADFFSLTRRDSVFPANLVYFGSRCLSIYSFFLKMASTERFSLFIFISILRLADFFYFLPTCNRLCR